MYDELTWGVPSFWIERFPLYYGRRQGFFQQRGISLEIKYFWGGPELAGAVSQGEIRIGELGLPPFLKAHTQGMSARAIGSSIIQQLDHYLVARPGVKSLEDLRGKRIGILSFGSCDDYFIHHILRASGVDPNTEVELVPLGSSYGDLACFSSGHIDAGFMIEPYVALGEDLGFLEVLASVKAFFPRYQWGVILASDALLTEDIDLVHRAMEAYRQSCRAIKTDPEAAVGLGAQVFRIKKDIFRRALYRDLGNWEVDAQIDLVGMENGLQIQQQLGIVPGDFDLAGAVYQL